MLSVSIACPDWIEKVAVAPNAINNVIQLLHHAASWGSGCAARSSLLWSLQMLPYTALNTKMDS